MYISRVSYSVSLSIHTARPLRASSTFTMIPFLARPRRGSLQTLPCFHCCPYTGSRRAPGSTPQHLRVLGQEGPPGVPPLRLGLPLHTGLTPGAAAGRGAPPTPVRQGSSDGLGLVPGSQRVFPAISVLLPCSGGSLSFNEGLERAQSTFSNLLLSFKE